MKKAFTLAEGLVTLIIVGVLSGVMVTSVVQQKPDKNKIMIRNAYAELTSVMNQLVGDSGLYPDFAEFGLGDNTAVSVHYSGTPFYLSDNRGKMCVGIRHYYNTITQDYINDNVSVGKPCRASFYTKSGSLVRFQVNKNDSGLDSFGGNISKSALSNHINNQSSTARFVIVDVNPTNNGEFASGDFIDTLQVRVNRSGRLQIVNPDAETIIKEAQVR